MPWPQVYDPLGSPLLSTLISLIPIALLLGGIALFKMHAHHAALLGLGGALAVAIAGFGMPAKVAVASAFFGAAYGLLPIGWIILNLIFLYQLTVNKGLFEALRNNLATVAPDPRLQLILIAFGLGAFFEGAAGFGTPVAVTAAILMGLGFRPLAASGLSLIANTAPVAFGALGTPVIALAGVTGLDIRQLSAAIGHQLPFFSLIIPFWVVWAYAGWRGMMGVWPAALTAGLCFAIPQYVVSTFHGPWLVDVIASVCSMGGIVLLLRVWKPREKWHDEEIAGSGGASQHTKIPHYTRAQVIQAWTPWVILSVLVFLWGIPWVKSALDGISVIKLAVPALDKVVQRVPPVVATATAEAAVFNLNWLSATGTGILVSAIAAGLVMGCTVRELAKTYWATLKLVRLSLVTISAMMALGYVTRYSGADATLGLAFARTGTLYPFFGTLLGWLGVALTGSDTASNVLFGSLQRITSEQLGVNPVLMAAANSSGGVMGKMVDAQSIVVASTATNWYGHESAILRYVFFHSIALASLVGLLVFLQARVPPFTAMIPH